jgi:dihydroneopterin aldolase
MLTRIHIDRLRVHARHGVLPQERTVGADFFVSLTAEVDTGMEALADDRLEGTVSYADLCADIRRLMQQPAQLLEHAAWTIARTLLEGYPRLLSITLRIDKQTPPIGMSAGAVGVEVTLAREALSGL